jgi:hypothetical protein
MNIPTNTITGFIGFALLAFGAFMILTGFDIISIQQVTVKKGRRTWILGFVFALVGVWLLLPEFNTKAPVADLGEPANALPVANTVPSIASSSNEVSGDPFRFIITNEAVWNQAADGSYTAIGNQDSIAWSNVVVEGDLELSFDIQYPGPNGEGGIIIYGDGRGLSDEQLFFGFGPVHSKIMGGSPYNTRFLDDLWMMDVDINKAHPVMIRIVNHKASLSFDGIEILSADIPGDINTSGRIGLYKYQGEPGMENNGATYSNFRLTASSIVEP